MGLAIRALNNDVPIGKPRPTVLVLTCDGAHAEPLSMTYGPEGSYIEWAAAARVDGWQLRVGDDARTLCRACRRDWANRPTVAERPRQFALDV